MLHIAHAHKPCQVCDDPTEGKPAITLYKIHKSALRRQRLIRQARPGTAAVRPAMTDAERTFGAVRVTRAAGNAQTKKSRPEGRLS